jgi:AcrR family transcriptional regulator
VWANRDPFALAVSANGRTKIVEQEVYMVAQSRAIVASKSYTSQRILSAAFKCISTKGSASVSLRDIADEAGVALSQLNYYYDNREKLFAAVLKAMKQEYLSSVEVKMASFSTLREKAYFLIKYNKELLQANQRLYRAFLDFFGLAMWSKSFRKEMKGFLHDISRVIENQIDHVTTGEEVGPAPHPPAALATMILGTTFGIAMQYLMDPERQEILNGFDILRGVI